LREINSTSYAPNEGRHNEPDGRKREERGRDHEGISESAREISNNKTSLARQKDLTTTMSFRHILNLTYGNFLPRNERDFFFFFCL
jgi:hypothetical protein